MVLVIMPVYKKLRLFLRFNIMANIAKKYFGTDGIRGKVGETPITADFLLK